MDRTYATFIIVIVILAMIYAAFQYLFQQWWLFWL